jgi:hypothetical protein
MANTVAQPLRAPAYRLMAERENEALVAKLPAQAAADLGQSLADQVLVFVPALAERWLSTLALEAVSRKLTSVTTSTGITSAERLDQGRAPGQ